MLRSNLPSLLALAFLVLPACVTQVESGGGDPPIPPGNGNEAGALCNEAPDMACDEGFFCDYPIDTMCGAIVDEAGTCKPRPEACDLNYDPVCGCDGQTHGNACEAQMAGTSVASTGECP